MKWSEEKNIVVDVNFIFDLIKNDKVPDDNIENQNFINLSTAFSSKEKTFFKIVNTMQMQVEEMQEEKIEDKSLDKKIKTQNKNISIIKGTDRDYAIDLRTGIQYVINKEKKDKNKNIKENQELRIQELIENLSLLISKQPEMIANATKEAIDEITKSINENTTPEELKEKIKQWV